MSGDENVGDEIPSSIDRTKGNPDSVCDGIHCTKCGIRLFINLRIPPFICRLCARGTDSYTEHLIKVRENNAAKRLRPVNIKCQGCDKILRLTDREIGKCKFCQAGKTRTQYFKDKYRAHPQNCPTCDKKLRMPHIIENQCKWCYLGISREEYSHEYRKLWRATSMTDETFSVDIFNEMLKKKLVVSG